MASRAWPRLWVLLHALPTLISRSKNRPSDVRRILIAHHLLLGDTIMLAPLMKRVRTRYPLASITMICNPKFVSLFAEKPYGVNVLPYNQRSLPSLRSLRSPVKFDIAFVPGDNRWAWLARALHSEWVVAFSDDNQSYKSWAIDEQVPMPITPQAWGDISSRLCDDVEPEGFIGGEWAQPPFEPFTRPDADYCVLHMGASSPHKLWASANWRQLITWLEKSGLEVVLTCGYGEAKLLNEVDSVGRLKHYEGTLDLAQMWQLLKSAKLLVCPDTGIAHLARIVGTPTVALFGPGSPIISGPGRFWKASQFTSVFLEDIPCRNQNMLFERKLDWVRHCWRTPQECGNPICMHSIRVDKVVGAISDLKVISLNS